MNFFYGTFSRDSLSGQRGLDFDGPPFLLRLLSSPFLRVAGLRDLGRPFSLWHFFRELSCMPTGSGFQWPSFPPRVFLLRLFSSGAWVSRILDVRFFHGTFSKDALSWHRGLVFDGPPSLPLLFHLLLFGCWALRIFSVNFCHGTISGSSFSTSSLSAVSPFRLFFSGSWVSRILDVRFFHGTFSKDALSWQRGLVFAVLLPSLCSSISSSSGAGLYGSLASIFVVALFRGLVFSTSAFSAVSPFRLFFSGSWASRILDVRFFHGTFPKGSLSWQRGPVFDDPPSVPSLFRLLSFGWWAFGIFSVNFCHGTFSGPSFPRSSLSAVCVCLLSLPLGGRGLQGS